MSLPSLTDATIGIALICCIAALTVIVILTGADSIPATGLRDLAILLGGGLLGAKVPKP